jgi:hypothetical protein
MSDLMIGYYLISGVLFLFFLGSGSIIYDMFWNKEKEIVIRKRTIQPEANVAQFVSNDYEYDNDLFDT